MKTTIGIAIACLSATAFGQTTFFDTPMYIGAHRGGGDLWPESTELAYKECIAAWPDIVLEADVHETKDGHVVVMHDKTVDRITNGEGPIGELTLEEARALDAGYDFTKDKGTTFPHRGKGLQILTLAEAFAIAPDSRWLVETKDGPNIMEKALAVIKEAGMESRVLLASFQPKHMTYAREHAPHIARCFDLQNAPALLGALRGGDWDAYDPPAQCVSLGKRMVGQTQITSEELAKLKTKGIYSQVHTLNKREEIDHYLAMGFDSILTDRPDILADAVKDFLAEK